MAVRRTAVGVVDYPCLRLARQPDLSTASKAFGRQRRFLYDTGAVGVRAADRFEWDEGHLKLA